MRNRFSLNPLLATPVVVCLLLAGFATAQDRQEAAAGRDAQDLQGEWQVIDFQTKGIADREMKNHHSIFRNDERIEFHFSSNWLSQENHTRFRLDPAKSPKQIDIVIHWRDPDWKDVTLLGIYSLDGDRLMVCTNNQGKRPTEFKSTNENGNTLSTYQRLKGDPSATLAFAKIQNDWVEASPTAVTAGTAAQLKRRQAMIAPDPEPFAERYLQFAAAHPEGFAGLVALCRAAFLAPDSKAGEQALALLEGGRVARADLDDLCRALAASQTTSSEMIGEKALAPHVLASVKRQLAHPSAARTLTWVCVTLAAEQSTSTVFAESAELIVTRFANSPDIFNLSEVLARANPIPAPEKCEGYLRTILEKNTHRMVRNRALYALASVVQRGGEARQPEAERLYHQFIAEIKDQPQAYNPDVYIEKMYLTQAQAEIAEIGSRGLGKPAPELAGEDLAGKPLKLSEFRGKVVLLSFWATWCRPCMRMVPHEKALVNRLPEKFFALVGVNGDVDPKQLRDVIKNENITWRSFKNKVGGQQAISEKWNIPGWPTVYLIDQQGIIRNRWTDTVPPEVLNREVDDLISGKSKSTGGIWSLLPTWPLSIWVGIGILAAVVATAITYTTRRRHSLPQ
jgi:uncharacterized protein (TIGR03067 family)